MGIGLSSVTALAACTVGVITSAACTFTTLAGLAGTLAGGVYCPLEVIVPTDALPPATPFTDQLTAVFEVPVTVAANCKDASPGRAVAAAGLTDTAGVVLEGELVPPAHPTNSAMPATPNAQSKAHLAIIERFERRVVTLAPDRASGLPVWVRTRD